MQRLRLPYLAGTRDLVHELLATQDVPASLAGEVLVALCRDMAAASESFADELVREVVVVRGADGLALVGAPSKFVEHCRTAAIRRRVRRRVQRRRAVEVGV